jgi:hypothetical protein
VDGVYRPPIPPINASGLTGKRQCPREPATPPAHLTGSRLASHFGRVSEWVDILKWRELFEFLPVRFALGLPVREQLAFNSAEYSRNRRGVVSLYKGGELSIDYQTKHSMNIYKVSSPNMPEAVYVGSTDQTGKARWSQHKCLKSNTCTSKHIVAAGGASLDILETVTDTSVNLVDREY